MKTPQCVSAETTHSAELSALIGVSEPTLCGWRYLRKGPKSFTLGRRVRYCETDVIAWINEERRKNPDGQ